MDPRAWTQTVTHSIIFFGLKVVEVKNLISGDKILKLDLFVPIKISRELKKIMLIYTLIEIKIEI